jgi:hypothetical protein
MKRGLALLRWMFSLALRVYPMSYQEEFGAEMLTVFSETIQAAARGGLFALLAVFMREMRDLPLNIIKIYVEKEFSMLRKLPVQTSPLFVRSVVFFGVMPLISSLVNSLEPLLRPFSLWLATIFSGLRLTDAMPTSGTYLPELELGLTGLSFLLMAFVLAVLFRRKISTKKVFLVWGLTVVLPALLWQAFFANYSLNFFPATDDSQVYFLLGQVRMFLIMLTGVALVYLFGQVVAESSQRGWFVLAGALGYPLIRFIGRSFFPGPKTLADSLQWTVLAGEIGYGLVFGVALGLLFGLVWYFSPRQEPSLKLA